MVGLDSYFMVYFLLFRVGFLIFWLFTMLVIHGILFSFDLKFNLPKYLCSRLRVGVA